MQIVPKLSILSEMFGGRRWVFAILLAAACCFAAEKAQEKIPVFIKAGGTAGGFTDPSKDRQDSMKDLQDVVKNSASVRLAESEKDAVAVLEVLDRNTKSEISVWGRQNKSYLTVRLTAGEYFTEFTDRAPRRAS
jgi:hypothetical protein